MLNANTSFRKYPIPIPLHILVSIHLANSSFYPLDPIITNAFDSPEEAAVEIDIGGDFIQYVITALNERYGMFHGDDSLEKNFFPTA